MGAELRFHGGEKGRGFGSQPPQVRSTASDRRQTGCVECFPGSCEAWGSVPSTAEMGRGANTVISALRNREQKFKLILGYIVSLRSVRAT